jgi:hypothetical protein
MKDLALVVGAALMGLVGLTGRAEAATVEFHGSLCAPATPDDAAKLTYSQWGVHNTASTAANVVCPITLNGITSARFSITAYDRNDSSTISDVICSVFGTSSDGNINLSTTLKTTGSAGPAFTVTSLNFVFASTSAHLQCAIPSFESGSGFSHLTSYRVITP